MYNLLFMFLLQSPQVLAVLGIKYSCKNLSHCLLWSACVENLVVARLRGKIVNLAVDGVDTLTIKLMFAAQDCVAVCS